MISLVLVDTELERAPDLCLGGGLPRVCSVKDEQLRGIIVLDSYIHRHILEGLEGASRRGRPDIAHSFLLLAQGSRARHEGWLRAYVHTRADEVIAVGHDHQPEQNYLSFLRDMGELVSGGSLAKGGMAFREGVSLEGLLEELGPDQVVALSPHGRCRDLRRALRHAKERHLAVLIGGFPEGDYRSPAYDLADVVVSLGDELLTVPDVTAQVLDSLP